MKPHKTTLKWRKHEESDRVQRQREDAKKLRKLQRYHARALKQVLDSLQLDED